MTEKRDIKLSDIARHPGEPLVDMAADGLMPLDGVNEVCIKALAEGRKAACECSLDGVSALGLPRPQSPEEEARLVESFKNGLKKLVSNNDNWAFLQPLTLSLDYCARCLACSEECPVYIASGRQEIYRPSYRSEILRRLIKKYAKGNLLTRFGEGDIELNWEVIARLAELSYRCTLCRRCAQACTRGVDNGLLTRELRKLFSQEMGIAPKELHKLGTMQQLKVGASTGVNPKAFGSFVRFMEDDIAEKTGIKLTIPVNKEGADILLIHNSGEFVSWMENPEAFAIIFEAAGLSWTLSSELGGYEATNYGVWYDDVQFARIALKQSEIARKLKVKRIIVGECGHAYKGLAVIADRILTGEANIPRETCLPMLEDLVCNGKLELDPSRNNFPVTLHDPCNIVRQMGIIEPQRQILRRVCPQFQEMEPHGTDNYCCGGGSGFSVISSMNFPDWKASIAGRMKVKQILGTFQDVLDPQLRKYTCAPCFTCKSQMRDLFTYYGLWDRYGILYGGLVELIVNAMPEIREPLIRWEWH